MSKSMDSDRYTRRFSISSSWLLLTCIASCSCSDVDTSLKIQTTAELGIKLDRVLLAIEDLTGKHDELTKIVLHLQHCFSQQQQANSPRSEKASYPQSDKENSVETSGDAEKPHESSQQSSGDKVTPGDLFHFNKLATTNVITGPLTNTPPTLSSWSDSSNFAGNFNGDELDEWTANSNEMPRLRKELIHVIGQKYEFMFSGALDNLNRLMKEQLGSFRMSLAKLMNRISEHNYQYNVVSNQLSLIKEECSLASSALAAFSTMPPSKSQPESPKQQSERPASNDHYHEAPGENTETTAQPVVNTMRTSDIAMIVRLLSQELNQQLAPGQANGKETMEEFVACKANEMSENKEQASLINETRAIAKRLDEIDSVAKQSALFLTKLSSTLLTNSEQVSAALVPRSQVILTYNSSNLNSTTAQPSSAAVDKPSLATSGQETRRWFPGSKVPGRSRQEAEQEQRQAVDNRPRCQSKTSLTRPQSCRQLRLAGANCTGQYYVFVRGSIRHLYCDMNMEPEDDGGGWTVILRRIDKSLPRRANASFANASAQGPDMRANHILEAFKASQVNFNLEWSHYKRGFGHLDDWGEFFVGLDLLHQLTEPSESSPTNSRPNRALEQTTELQLDLETSDSNELHLRFDKFHVAAEGADYRVSFGACNASSQTLCEPLSQLNATRFYTFDHYPNGTNCDRQFSGWWLPSSAGRAGEETSACPRRPLVSLTAPMGRSAVGGEDQHIHWPSWAHSNEPLRRIVMKVRRVPVRRNQAEPKLASEII